MATAHLTERRVDALMPRKSAYDVRNRELTGFGVRVLPSGARRYFIHSQHDGRRVWKLVGQAGALNVDKAHNRARAMLAAIRNGNDDEAAAPSAIPFETVADEVFRRYARNWKPSALRVNRNYYRNHILPWFEGRLIAEIAVQDVRRWFASLHNTPVSADRSAPILSVIMRQAEVYGYRPEGTNPCAGIRRYRRQGRQRFLSTAEIRRLGGVLARHEAEHPQAAAVIRLLLLTGCRKGEIVTLKWRYLCEGKLFLPDSKTGPRRVFLNAPARAILKRQPRTGSAFVFPSPSNSGRPLSGDLKIWRSVRREAEIEDVRLHDLRHTFASHAVLRGIPLPVVSRLLGHKQPSMTMRYSHVEDREIEAAAERIGVAIERALDGGEVARVARILARRDIRAVTAGGDRHAHRRRQNLKLSARLGEIEHPPTDLRHLGAHFVAPVTCQGERGRPHLYALVAPPASPRRTRLHCPAMATHPTGDCSCVLSDQLVDVISQ